jgi:hypothetical protein
VNSIINNDSIIFRTVPGGEIFHPVRSQTAHFAAASAAAESSTPTMIKPECDCSALPPGSAAITNVIIGVLSHDVPLVFVVAVDGHDHWSAISWDVGPGANNRDIQQKDGTNVSTINLPARIRHQPRHKEHEQAGGQGNGQAIDQAVADCKE